jgi:hypothetical protein
MRNLLMLISTVGLLIAGRPVLAQADVKTAASMDGQCRAEIGGQAGACQPIGTFVEFDNGRALFLFSYAGTLYSLSGSRFQRRSEEVFALIVDMVRTASATVPERELPGAEGECVVQMDEDIGGVATIDCSVRSRGQNVRYRFVLDHITNFKGQTFH